MKVFVQAALILLLTATITYSQSPQGLFDFIGISQNEFVNGIGKGFQKGKEGSSTVYHMMGKNADGNALAFDYLFKKSKCYSIRAVYILINKDSSFVTWQSLRYGLKTFGYEETSYDFENAKCYLVNKEKGHAVELKCIYKDGLYLVICICTQKRIGG